MAIVIDIKPEVAEELGRQAAAHGVGVEAYVAGLLEEAAHAGAQPKMLGQDQLDLALKQLAQFSDKIPLLPDDAFSRESIYRDHD